MRELHTEQELYIHFAELCNCSNLQPYRDLLDNIYQGLYYDNYLNIYFNRVYS